MDVDELDTDGMRDDETSERRDSGAQSNGQPTQNDAVERARSQTASDVMSRLLLTVTPGEHVLLAWELLESAGVHHLPVVENGRCLAVLDDRLLAREWVVGPLSRPQRRVRELCTGPAPSVSPDTPVDQIARMMHLTGADAVTVIDNREFVGLVTVHDLLAVLAGEPRRQFVVPEWSNLTAFTLVPVPLHDARQ